MTVAPSVAELTSTGNTSFGVSQLPPSRDRYCTAGLGPLQLLLVTPFPFLVWGVDELRRARRRRTPDRAQRTTDDTVRTGHSTLRGAHQTDQAER